MKKTIGQIDLLIDKITEREALLSDKKFDQAVFYLMDNWNLLKQSLSADMDYSQLFEKLRKLNKKIKGISKPFHYMPKKHVLLIREGEQLMP
ncbi:hypothetical protein [uncultured Lactobacillus sp.]|uniref:hypothetical protein n=1 Tax=uncultured Lactobacillus sp. TaxID=153152 RepID=UPI002602C9A6|nr:hypothetical protein [uncultured Lactobacillus sp.]